MNRICHYYDWINEFHTKIRYFFLKKKGLNIANDGIMMVIDFSGRFNGEAFVTFNTIDDALDSLNRHKQKISNR